MTPPPSRPSQVQAGLRMTVTRLVALVPTVLMAIAFEATNTFDFAAQVGASASSFPPCTELRKSEASP